jgi:hypothetical protein
LGFNTPQVKVFFDLFKTELDKHNFMPSRIFNADETGVPAVPTEIQMVLAARGVKRVAKDASAERGKTVTISRAVFCAACFCFPESSHASGILGRCATGISWIS